MEEYTNFNNLIWKDKQLKSNEKLVLIYLITNHNAKLNYAYPTRKQIQEDTGISENTLNKILKNLEAKGYITKQKHITKSGNNNIYYIHKYLATNDNMTVSEATGNDLTTKSTNYSIKTIKPLTDENREVVELSTNEQLLKDNAKLNHKLTDEQKEQVNKLDTDRLTKAIKQANKFANAKYSLNYILAIYKNNHVNATEEPHRDTRGNVVRGAYQQKINTKPLTKYHNTFNEHYKNYTEDELEAKLLKMQAKRKIRTV